VTPYATGQVLGGRYVLERRLGEGGMGAVWSARNQRTGGRVAVKLIKPSSLADDEARRRLLREARAATLVEHPNILPVRDVIDLPDGVPALVMDLLEGETLANRLRSGGPLDLASSAAILLPVVSGVGAAHTAGVVHRDLKPDNIFLAKISGQESPRILDFGLARALAGSPSPLGSVATQSGALLGTPAYMAPEQFFGERDLDHRIDVWAIGIIAHELLTGARPFPGDSFGQIGKLLLADTPSPSLHGKHGVPDDLAEVLDKMLLRDRAARLADLRPLFEVLSHHTTVRAPAFGPPGAGSPSIPPDVVTGERTVDPSAETIVERPVEAAAAATLGSVTAPRSGQSTTIPTRPFPRALVAAIAILSLGAFAVVLTRVMAQRGSEPTHTPTVGNAPASTSAPATSAPSVIATAIVAPAASTDPVQPVASASAVETKTTATAFPKITIPTVAAHPGVPASASTSAAIVASSAPKPAFPSPSTPASASNPGLVVKPPF